MIVDTCLALLKQKHPRLLDELVTGCGLPLTDEGRANVAVQLDGHPELFIDVSDTERAYDLAE